MGVRLVRHVAWSSGRARSSDSRSRPSTDASRGNVSLRFRSDDLDRCDHGASRLPGQQGTVRRRSTLLKKVGGEGLGPSRIRDDPAPFRQTPSISRIAAESEKRDDHLARPALRSFDRGQMDPRHHQEGQEVQSPHWRALRIGTPHSSGDDVRQIASTVLGDHIESAGHRVERFVDRA